MSDLDPVRVIREAVTAITGAPTTTVLDVGFTAGPMPLVHVALLVVDGYVDTVATLTVDVYATTPAGPGTRGAAGIASALRRSLGAGPLDTPAGFVDDVAVTQQSGARPYYEQVEVASMVLDVTYRPTD